MLSGPALRLPAESGPIPETPPPARLGEGLSSAGQQDLHADGLVT